MTDKLLGLLQSLLPHHAISRLTGFLAALRWRPLKNLMIRVFNKLYVVQMSEALETDPLRYESFNAFFTRELRADARPVDERPGAIVSPVDGRVSQSGVMTQSRLVQAKGRDYSVRDLLARDSTVYEDGVFATIYLAPHNYHRIHMPVAATLHKMTYVPGRLYSVSLATSRVVDRLFARNERVIFEFETNTGPMALVMVGAMNVGSIETVHDGVVAPAAHRKIRHWDYAPGKSFEKGAELGRFNLGSTVVLLFGPGQLVPSSVVAADTIVRVGERIAQRIDSR